MRYLLVLALCFVVFSSTIHVDAAQDNFVEPLDSIIFSKDGKYIYAIEQVNSSNVVVWETATGRQVKVLSEEFGPTPMAWATFSPDNSAMLVNIDQQLLLWNITDGKIIPARFSDPNAYRTYSAGKFSSNGKQVFLLADNAPSDGLAIQVCDAQTGDILRKIPVLEYANRFIVSPNDKLIVLYGETSVSVYDMTTGSKLGSPGFTENETRSPLAFLPDNKTLVMINASGKIEQWDATTLKLLHATDIIEDLAEDSFQTTLSHNGKYLFLETRSGSNAGLGQLLNTETGQMLQTFPMMFEGTADVTGSFAFSPDDTKLVSRHFGIDGGLYLPLQLWDIKTGHFVRRFTEEIPHAITAESFSQPLYMLLTPVVADDVPYEERSWNTFYGGGDLWKWTGGDSATQVSHWGYNLHPVTSPDGKYIAYQSLPQATIDYLNSIPNLGLEVLNYTLPLNIWVLEAASDQASRIADQPDSLHVDTTANDLVNGFIRSVPTFSPDSKQIAWIEADQPASKPSDDSEPIMARLMIYNLASHKISVGANNLDLSTLQNMQSSPLKISDMTLAWSNAGIILNTHVADLPEAYDIIDQSGKLQNIPRRVSVYSYPGVIWISDNDQQVIGSNSSGAWNIQDSTGTDVYPDGLVEAYNPLASDGSTLQYDGEWQLTTPFYNAAPLIGCGSPNHLTKNIEIGTLAISPDGKLAVCANLTGTIGSLLVFDRTGLLTQIRTDNYLASDLSWGGLAWRVAHPE